MRKMLAAFALLGLITIVTVDANAQRPGFGGGFNRGGISNLITNKGVLEEIKCTDEQKEQLTEKMKSINEKRKEMFTKAKDMSKEERQTMTKEINAETQKIVDAVLKPEQTKRLKQIERQQDVMTTLTSDEEIVKLLKITDEQKEKLKTIHEESVKEQGELAKDRKNRKENAEKITALRKEGTEKAVKVLTSEQQDQWKDLTGAAYEVKFEPGTGFRGKNKKPNENE